MILLSTLVPSMTVHNVWDLPLWAWWSYESFHDEYVKQQREAAPGG